ncbi:hypothetical protein PENSPDRAFT_653279 [Peniophora sp. CONT]|nr:hypothetical protein PENSPDRAFT_653279 [Peniophora sp. CONT]
MGEVGSELRDMQDVEMSNDNSVIPVFGAQPQSALFGHTPAIVVPQLLLNGQPWGLPTLPSAATQHQSAFAPPRFVAQSAPITPRSLRPEAMPFVPGQQTHSVHPSLAPAYEGLLDSLNLAVDSGPGSGPFRDLNTFPDVPGSGVKASAVRRRARFADGQSAGTGEEAGPGKARGRKVSQYRSHRYDYDDPRERRRSRFHDRSPTPELVPDREPLPPMEPTRQLSAAEIEANKEAYLNLQRQKGHGQEGHKRRHAEAKALQDKRMARWEEMTKNGTESKAKAIMESNDGMWQIFWEKEKKLAEEEGWELPAHPSQPQATSDDDSDSESEEDNEEDWEEVQIVIQDPDGRVTAQ